MAKSGCGLSAALVKKKRNFLASYGAECYRHSFPPLKRNTRHLFLASYGAECSRHSFPTLKRNTRHLFLASYGAECSRHSFPTLKTNTRHLFIASYGAECSRHSFPTLKRNTRHLFLASYGAECSRHSFPTLKRNTRHLFLASDTDAGNVPAHVISDAKEITCRHVMSLASDTDAGNVTAPFMTLNINVGCLSCSVGNEWREHSAPYDAKNKCRVFPTLKTITRHLFLASYGAECYPILHLFPPLYRFQLSLNSFPTFLWHSKLYSPLLVADKRFPCLENLKRIKKKKG